MWPRRAVAGTVIVDQVPVLAQTFGTRTVVIFETESRTVARVLRESACSSEIRTLREELKRCLSCHYDRVIQ